MKKNFTILLFTLFGITNIFGQQENSKSKKAIYDDWPITVKSNAEKKNSSSDVNVNYVPIGTIWDHKIISYFFENGTDDIAGNGERQAIRDAFAIWEAQTNLYFLEVCSASSADIVFLWETFNHGDSAPFDGVGNVLAHTLGGPPPNNFGDQAGDIHFDDSETWTFRYST